MESLNEPMDDHDAEQQEDGKEIARLERENAKLRGLLKFTKDCACDGPSETGRVIVTQRTEPVTGAIVMTTTFYPMPTCCKCDKPWRQKST